MELYGRFAPRDEEVRVQLLAEFVDLSELAVICGVAMLVDNGNALALDALVDQVLAVHVVSPLPVLRLFRSEIDHAPVFSFVVSQLRGVNHAPSGLQVQLLSVDREVCLPAALL